MFTPAYQVVIIGGGPAGTATALQLQRSGVRQVLIVEKGAYAESRVGESLPPGANVLLHQLGLREAFLAEQHLPVYGSRSIWGSEQWGYNDYLTQKHGYGWHLDRRRFDEFLARQAQAAGAELRVGLKFLNAEAKGDGFCLNLENAQGGQEKVEARFVVDASGPQAVFARKMLAERQLHDRLVCISAFFDIPPQVELPALTHLEAVEYGWWYTAALPGGKVVIALATDPETIHHHQLTDSQNWTALLHHTRVVPAFLARNPSLPKDLLVTPALSCRLGAVNGKNWLAVGDAAATYDPISSLGIYKSLSMGAYVGKAVCAALQNNTGLLSDYAGVVATDFALYLDNRNRFYTAEQQWPRSPFWRRRVAARLPEVIAPVLEVV